MCADICGKVARTAAAALLAVAVSSPVFVSTPSEAAGDTRSLKLYFIHTGEKAVITYKRNGKFDPKGLEQLNRFLRDWRKNQPTKMDPRLFDLIWEVYRQSGSRDYINVVCGFRSPGTNEMLRGRSRNSGVAEKSQHMLGKAMDFFIPDVKLATLRGIGMKMQVGGVGFYPKSGSPFVHMDVGGVRAWPRMSRDELVRLFPNGNTIHIPADGKPLPGYQQAMADYKRRVSGTQIEIASASESAPKHKTLFAALFGGGADEQEDDSDDSAPVAVAKATPPKAAPEPAPVEPQQTEVADLNAPVPQVRPAFSNQPAGSDVASALIAPPSGNAAQQALAAALPADQAQPQQFADLSAYSIPVPSLLGPRRAPGDAEVASLMGNNGLPVPTPIERPAVAENLLAAADADPEAEADEAEQDALSPAVADALEQQRNEGESQIAKAPEMTVEQAINAAMTQKAPAAKPPLELAALAPPMTKSASFGDGFDQPAADSAASQGLPAKGRRPTQKEAAAADASRTTVRTEPKLTEKMISQWALTNARLEMASKQVKAPRFVSQTMRAQPTAVYAEGFNVKTASVDPARFSGTAVNFMEVRKFNTN
ncbi:peptidase M15 family protein [Rhizobium sp. N541]|nr:peptidase M15 family protein [Rhizobium sp. N324]ANM18622.1 peptidase M15 family protein [Rhizobium sp. N541]ANM25008.1 peptidase M15 family protein [Rhizobium sp. N941]OYD05739.1 peptidase M15 family protein [Rhizobium sp. N4311]